MVVAVYVTIVPSECLIVIVITSLFKLGVNLPDMVALVLPLIAEGDTEHVIDDIALLIVNELLDVAPSSKL